MNFPMIKSPRGQNNPGDDQMQGYVIFNILCYLDSISGWSFLLEVGTSKRPPTGGLLDDQGWIV